ETAEGFINDADLLTVGTLAVEKYEAAARALADAALERDGFRERFLGACDPAVFEGTEHSGARVDCARAFAREFGLRAWRRPLSNGEVDRVVDVVVLGAQDRRFDAGLELGVRSMLLSPNFLFRAEDHGEGVRDLDGFEIASRLSYSLWATMPDEELLDLAASGGLNEEDALRGQIDRMMEDPRFDAFVDEFAARWLKVSKLPEAHPDEEAFASFDEALRQAMEDETKLFVRHVIENDLPLTTLVDADFTFLNERLAAHYGVDGVEGEEMRLVRLDGLRRGGLLTQGSVLTVTSHATRTSPVLRGVYILDRLLCAPPPDPPADVDSLGEDATDDETGETLTLRERLEQHRADPECAGCHDVMDPLGFGLENYDAVGAWRETDEGEPIDSYGELPDGRSFEGAAELGLILAEDPRFTECVGEKLLTYSLGRALRAEDACTLDGILERAELRGGTLRALIEETVLDDVFRRVGTTQPEETPEESR
ncbi:MAG TPA: DUF1592 domain-containing protein, partial [Polyangiaceae bacterium LLY-WYZ-15_(1-7)]|nr:DUF1592 domain-containing protein [Polyangiaceae bacterium LLY-WYZ-15_(1-7)]